MSINDVRITPMTDLDALIRRIDQEVAAEVGCKKPTRADTK
jgi:hypothetical protein